jgi:hypothetical protein
MCSVQNIIIKARRMRWAGHVVHMGEKRNANGLLVGKPEGKPLGRPRCRWVNNIMMDLEEIESGELDWICLAQDGHKWTALVNLRVPSNAGKLSSGFTVSGLSSSPQLHS